MHIPSNSVLVRFLRLQRQQLVLMMYSVLVFYGLIGISVSHANASLTVTTVITPMLLLDDESGSGTPPPPPDGSLFQINQLQYKGAFRFKPGNYGGDGSNSRYSVNYAVGTLAYNPNNHSLFVAGHAQGSRVAEFPIPTPGTQATVSQLPESAAPLQDFVDIFPSTNDQGLNRVTGMMVHNNALIINAEQWYNADGANTDTTLVVSNFDDLDGTINAFFRLNGRAHSAGYMGQIPAGLQGLFNGAKYYTGWSSVYSIVSRYSYSPSLWTFDPDDLTTGNVSTNPNIGATPYMNFAYSSAIRDLLDNYDPDAEASPLWNILSRGVFGFFVPGTKTFAVFGSSGGVQSGIGYKITQTNGNLCGGYCSYNPNDNYNYYWLYNVDDILAAENLSDPRPYAFGQISLPFDDNGSHKVIGGTVDTANNTIYVALSEAGQVGTYDRPPVVLVYDLPTAP